MSDSDVLSNQKLILENQHTIKSNQVALDTILKNQELILSALKK